MSDANNRSKLHERTLLFGHANAGRRGQRGLKLPTFISRGVGASHAEQELCQPAPNRDPAGFSVTFSHQESAQSGEMTKEVSNRENRFAAQGAKHRQPDSRPQTSVLVSASNGRGSPWCAAVAATAVRVVRSRRVVICGMDEVSFPGWAAAVLDLVMSLKSGTSYVAMDHAESFQGEF
jgi:hypothetical protein